MNILTIIATGIVCITLAACADGPASNYPSLSQITDIGKILTPEERDKALADMQKAEKTQARDAIKEIEKR